MEATHKRAPLEGLRRFAGTRRGAVTVAAGAAVLAGLVLLAFASQYRDRVQGGTLERSVLVADRLIPKGTSGATVVGGGLFRARDVQAENVDGGALASAAGLADKVATRDIYPGEQLTADAFASNADPIRGQLTGTQRAITVPLDEAHGLVGEVRAGDHVDVLAGFNATSTLSGRGRPFLGTLLRDVLVLKVPSDGDSAQSDRSAKNLTVRVGADQANQLAFASDNGKVWFVLRPPAGAKDVAQRPSATTLERLLAGTPSIEIGRTK
ncbi:MAG TPA: Flp pilus assembly protein CpaB [Solirubrobacteraceae bacterium]|nr:Flp pilus assembly protein CpaB [Solirubrobacteraceae bacterium]